MHKTLLTALLLTTICIPANISTAKTPPSTTPIAQADLTDGTLTPQEVQQTAKNITVRITAANNGGSGVIIAQKGNNYLILTNAHVVRRATKIEIQAPDGQKYQATAIDGGFDSKYDLALLQFTSKTKYTLANLSNTGGSPLTPERTIYSAGFPFDSKDIRITSGQVSQLSDIPFDDGTQIGYIADKGQKGIRQGMSGGAIFDAQGNLLGINTVGVAPILPNYTYNDGSKPLAKLKAQYARANWGIPIYNFLTNVKADILYGYANLPKVERQVTPTGYMAKLNIKARQMTVRIENSGGNGSGVIVARDASGYYVLTAKHVVQDYQTQAKFTNHQIITADQDRHSATGTVVAEGVDLAVMKFSSNNKYSLAQLGEYAINTDDLAFVGGFPGRDRINSPLWQWQLNPGFTYDREQGKFQTQSNQSFSNGYDLIYSSISYGGMSGGPVFDSQGNVIGIHGRSESTDTNSLGISIQVFTGLVDKLQVNPSLLNIVKSNPGELSSENRKNVFTTMNSISEPQVGDDRKRWLAYANQLARIREYDKSIAAFDRAISKGEILLGNNGKSWSLRGIKKYQLAEIAISKAIAIVPASERAKYYYLWKDQSMILKQLEKYDAALKSIDLAISLESNDLTLLNEKGRILSDTGQHKNSIAIYDLIIRRQPESSAYNNRGKSKYELGEKKGAVNDFDRAISLNPKYVAAYSNRGLAKAELGDKQGAIVDYSLAISLNPKFSSAYSNRGITKSKLGDQQGAILDYDLAIKLDPNNQQAYNSRGVVKFDLGNTKAAIIDYNRAIAIDPKYANAYLNRSTAKYSLGDIQAAMIDCEQSITLNPNLAEAYTNRGIIKSKLGNYQAAIVDHSRAITLDPKNALAYNNRGVAKGDLGDKQGAIADYDRAILIDAKYSIAYNNRGVAKFDLDNGRGNGQAAILDYNRAIILNPNYIQAYVNRGTVKSMLLDRQGAIIDFTKVIALDSQHAGAYGKRGIDRYNLGDRQNAIIDVNKASELFRQQGRMDLYQKSLYLLEKMKEG